MFKDGQFVRTFASMAEVDRDLLVKTMVGRELTDIYGCSPRPLGEAGLKVEHLMGPGLKAPVSLEVKSRGDPRHLRAGGGRAQRADEAYLRRRDTSGAAIGVWQTGGHSEPHRRHSQRHHALHRRQEGAGHHPPIHSVQENINISARRHHARGGFWINQCGRTRTRGCGSATCGSRPRLPSRPS